MVGNYIDNCFVEWTNEHEAEPTFTSGFGFSSLSVSDNVFLSGAVAAWFAYIVVKPFGARHSVSNLTVNGNNFRSINGVINRIERVVHLTQILIEVSYEIFSFWEIILTISSRKPKTR